MIEALDVFFQKFVLGCPGSRIPHLPEGFDKALPLPVRVQPQKDILLYILHCVTKFV